MSLAITMQEARIRVVAMDGMGAEASLFLHTVGESGYGPQTILRRLNDPQVSFLPVRVGDRVELVNLESIAYLAVEGRPPEVAALEEVCASKARVALVLASGEGLEGDLLYEQPPGQSRVSDLLNNPQDRFLLLVNDGQTRFVRRGAILRVREELRTS